MKQTKLQGQTSLEYQVPVSSKPIGLIYDS